MRLNKRIVKYVVASGAVVTCTVCATLPGAVSAAAMTTNARGAAATAPALTVAGPLEHKAAVTPSITVISAHQSLDPIIDLPVISGVLENTGSDAVWGAWVSLALDDASGHVLEQNDANTYTTANLAYLAPGERSGFSLILLDPPVGYDHFTVLSATAEDSAYLPNHNFTVKATGATDDGNGGTLISGTITNRNTITVDGVDISFTFFDAAGKSVEADLGEASVGTTLSAGQTAPFEYDYMGPAYATFTATAEATQTHTGPVGCISCAPFSRVAGSTRTGTAVAASQAQYGAGAAKAVVLARDDKFPDALAGGPLASHVGGPLLLTSPTGLDLATKNEIQRVAPSGSTVYILGGPAAIASAVDDELTTLGYQPKRIYGDTRFATAVAIAQEMGSPTTIFEATGLNYPDALAGGPAAAAAGAAILLTNGSQQAPETAAYLASLSTSTRYALGGPAANADPSATPIVGADRFDTSNQIARTFFPSPTKLGIATAYNFPDALGAGPLLASQKAPLILMPSDGLLSVSTYEYLADDAGSSVTAGTVFGGNLAVSNEVVTWAQVDLEGSGR